MIIMNCMTRGVKVTIKDGKNTIDKCDQREWCDYKVESDRTGFCDHN